MSAPLTGPLEPLLLTPGVTDVLVNAPDQVWVDRGRGLERAAVAFDGAGAVRDLAVRLAAAGGRRLDDAQPTVDARLPDGTRLHAVLPPVADGCAAISLRRVRTVALAMTDLVAGGAVPLEIATMLEALVRARVPVLVSGATGAGKTTLLSSLLGAVPHHERIVLIEEAGEVVPDHPHVVRLVERRPNVEGAGGVGLDVLVREALRMRPDRLVLGECRGAELREVLAAANTGHRGTLTTVHANSCGAVPARLEALAAMAGLTAGQLARQAQAAFEVVVHLVRDGAGRRVAEVGMLTLHHDSLDVHHAVEVDPHGEVHFGTAWHALQRAAA